MRVLVCGGRNYNNRSYLFAYMDVLLVRSFPRGEPITVIHGAAPGADTLAGQWAKERGFGVLEFPARWADISHPNAVIRVRKDGSKYDALAGHRRNQSMIDEGKPDLAVAFPGGTGTADMRQRVYDAGIKLIIVKGASL
jgi:YspA, cpYpsA-related SLOG family